MVGYIHELVIAPKSLILRVIDVVEAAVILGPKDAKRVKLVSYIPIVVPKDTIRIRIEPLHVIGYPLIPPLDRRYHVIRCQNDDVVLPTDSFHAAIDSTYLTTWLDNLIA